MEGQSQYQDLQEDISSQHSQRTYHFFIAHCVAWEIVLVMQEVASNRAICTAFCREILMSILHRLSSTIPTSKLPLLPMTVQRAWATMLWSLSTRWSWSFGCSAIINHIEASRSFLNVCRYMLHRCTYVMTSNVCFYYLNIEISQSQAVMQKKFMCAGLAFQTYT